MLESIKDALRLYGTELDGEVIDLIEAAKADLRIAGILPHKILDTDPLIKRAITVYCKANFGYEDPKYADRFQCSYISLKQHLLLSQEYNEVV